MERPNDCTLSPNQFSRVRAEAERALRESGSLGVFPTPVEQIMANAKVAVVENEVLNPSFIFKMRSEVKKIGGTLKKALSKVLGLFQASTGFVFLDRTIIEVKKRFVLLHETGHGFMPWQRPMYALVEDCEKSLDPESAELFDREANVFAAEVLFQLDSFRDMAKDHEFSIYTPIQLAKTFNASLYASIRQYVSKNSRACAVLVLNMPELVENVGFHSTLRRVVVSPTFIEIFGNFAWKNCYTPDDEIGAIIPIGKSRSSGKSYLTLQDRNGYRHECIAEVFTNTYQVFVLIHSVRTLTSLNVVFSQ